MSPQRKPAPIISLFNHKGGVSKTTTTFNLGWALADLGKRILIVDADPQCNLTGTVLGFGHYNDFNAFYARSPLGNIFDCLNPVFSSSGSIQPAQISPTGNGNLFLLAGKIDLAEAETQIAVALSTVSAIPALQNIPGAMCKLLRLTAQRYEIDAVLVDMSPSVGALNQCFLMGSDFFVVPTSPDYYCDQAITSLARVLPRWNMEVAPFRKAGLVNAFPSAPPQFCGMISQRYRPRSGAPAQSFQQWIDKIKTTVNSQLVPALTPHGMSISPAAFNAARPADTPFNLVNIADFNSLIAQSQKFSTPVFALTDAQLEQAGFILETMKTSRAAFQTTFNQLATTVCHIASI